MVWEYVTKGMLSIAIMLFVACIAGGVAVYLWCGCRINEVTAENARYRMELARASERVHELHDNFDVAREQATQLQKVVAVLREELMERHERVMRLELELEVHREGRCGQRE